MPKISIELIENVFLIQLFPIQMKFFDDDSNNLTINDIDSFDAYDSKNIFNTHNQFNLLSQDISQSIISQPLQNIISLSPKKNSQSKYKIQNHQNLFPHTDTIHGSWTQKEDEALNVAIKKFGKNKWSDIAKAVGSRTPKQVRERWTNCLCPGLKKEPFEQWEDEIIISMQKEVGNKWATIARSIPGRSAGAIKNRWYSSLKSSKLHSQIIPLNKTPETDSLNSTNLHFMEINMNSMEQNFDQFIENSGFS